MVKLFFFSLSFLVPVSNVMQCLAHSVTKLFVCFHNLTSKLCDRYADLARAYKEKEKESEKLRDVLAKTQDKALRKVSKKQ